MPTCHSRLALLCVSQASYQVHGLVGRFFIDALRPILTGHNLSRFTLEESVAVLLGGTCETVRQSVVNQLWEGRAGNPSAGTGRDSDGDVASGAGAGAGDDATSAEQHAYLAQQRDPELQRLRVVLLSMQVRRGVLPAAMLPLVASPLCHVAVPCGRAMSPG